MLRSAGPEIRLPGLCMARGCMHGVDIRARPCVHVYMHSEAKASHVNVPPMPRNVHARGQSETCMRSSMLHAEGTMRPACTHALSIRPSIEACRSACGIVHGTWLVPMVGLLLPLRLSPCMGRHETRGRVAAALDT